MFLAKREDGMVNRCRSSLLASGRGLEQNGWMMEGCRGNIGSSVDKQHGCLCGCDNG